MEVARRLRSHVSTACAGCGESCSITNRKLHGPSPRLAARASSTTDGSTTASSLYGSTARPAGSGAGERVPPSAAGPVAGGSADALAGPAPDCCPHAHTIASRTPTPRNRVIHVPPGAALPEVATEARWNKRQAPARSLLRSGPSGG